MNFKNLLLFIFFTICCKAQNPVLIGYWQNWNDAGAPYIPLDQIDSRYDIVCVSFAVPTSPSDMHMLFAPDMVSQATLISQIQTLRSQGKKVLLSIGGATTSISLNDVPNREAFVSSMTSILNTYHFDGIDVDIEHGNSILAAGTISSPTNGDAINLIYAITQIRGNYFDNFNTPMMLTFAPETAYVQGGMAAYGGIWGGYLPILDALRDSIDYIHVQLYNTGSMYGINGNIYNQGTADFIVAMTEALIHGFNTAGGPFDGFPSNKIVVGLPACPNAAGGGFTPTPVVRSAINYLMGYGPQPGSYALAQTSGYPDLGGMMTWSINWDKVATCNSNAYEYAQNFDAVFNPLQVKEFDGNSFSLYPNPVANQFFINGKAGIYTYEIFNLHGKLLDSGTTENNKPIATSFLSAGIYFVLVKQESSQQTFKIIKT